MIYQSKLIPSQLFDDLNVILNKPPDVMALREVEVQTQLPTQVHFLEIVVARLEIQVRVATIVVGFEIVLISRIRGVIHRRVVVTFVEVGVCSACAKVRSIRERKTIQSR